LPSLAQIQAVAAAQAQAAQAMAPAPVAEPQAPAPGGDQALPVVHEATQAGAELEAFVQKAVQMAKGETPAATEAPESAQGDTTPTFQDLVKLVMDAGKTGTDGQPAQSDGSGAQFTGQQPTVAEAAAPAVEENDPEPGTVTSSIESSPVSRQHAAAAADGPQESPRQPVEPEQVVRQVTRFIKVMVDSKQSEVRLNLHPEHLGHIAVKLVVGDGAIRANLVAQDMAVKAALEANLDQLKTRLSEQGFQVEQVHVTVGSDGGLPQHSRQGEQRQPQQQQSHWRQHHQENRNPQDPAPAQSRPAPAPWSLRGTGVRLNSLA
jgi:flagellar hook-length control protein FliK